MSVDIKLGALVAMLLTLLVFLTAGGTDLGPNTLVEILLTFVGVGTAVLVLVRGAPGRARGAVTFSLFGAVAVLTFVSIAWSVQPSDSWLEANRTLSYLAAFGAALALARLKPNRWSAMLGGIAATAIAVSAYALLAKVFPGTFAPHDQLGRVSAPLDYWNASGLLAGMGIPACMWAGARTDRSRWLRALSMPAISILVAVLVLSYSRGALLMTIVGLLVWFALVPLRLRGALVLAVGSAGGAIIAGWALSAHTFSHDQSSLAARTTSGHSFGLVLVLVLAVMIVAGFAAAFAMDRVMLPAGVRRQVAVGLVGLLCLVPLAAVVALAASSRGLPGEVSHIWNSLTTPNSGVVGDNPGRLVQLGNTRPTYWREALKVGDRALLKGTGALGFSTASLRYAQPSLVASHAHGYPFETFADFGLIGVVLNLALLIAWAIAADRALALRAAFDGLRGEIRQARAPGSRSAPLHSTRDGLAERDPFGEERVGLLTMLAIVVIFGLHSAIDWTWFVPGTAIPALLCAGWLAGRGPLGECIGLRSSSRTVSQAPGRYGLVLVLVTVGLGAAWAVWQPLRATSADNAALSEIASGHLTQALADARSAVARNPLSVEPLFELAAIYTALGDDGDAHAQLAHAVTVQPDNPASWQRLGEFDLQEHQPLRALHVLRVGLRLYPRSAAIQADLVQAAALRVSQSAR